jgi:hypothetical protein
MNIKHTGITLLTSSLLLAFCATTANAGQLLKCEKRGTTRSRISVTVEDQTPGALYTASVKSGTNKAKSTLAADDLGVAEFDFDSNKKDIAAGAAPIAPTFIGKSVTVKVTDALGTIIDQDTVACKIR